MASVVDHLRAGGNCTLNSVQIRGRDAIERLVRFRDRPNGGNLVEVANVTGLVLIDSQQVMRLHIADEINAQNQFGLEFPLYADTHLHGARRAIVRVVHLPKPSS